MIQCDCCLYKKIYRDTQKNNHVINTAEIAVMCLEAKEHQGLPVTPEAKRKAWDRFSPTDFGESKALRTLNLRLPDFRTVGTYISVVLGHAAVVLGLSSPKKVLQLVYVLLY